MGVGAAHPPQIVGKYPAQRRALDQATPTRLDEAGRTELVHQGTDD
jgi:hypothetical protein